MVKAEGVPGNLASRRGRVSKVVVSMAVVWDWVCSEEAPQDGVYEHDGVLW